MSNSLDEIFSGSIPSARVLTKFGEWLKSPEAAEQFKINMKPYTGGRISYQVPKLATERLIEMTQAVIDVLERDGWTQGKFYGPDNTVCMMAAANRAAGITKQTNGAASPQVEAWADAVCRFFGWDSVPSFNDDRETNYEMVIGKLRDFLYELKGR